MSSALVTFRLIFVVIYLPLLIKGCTFPSDLTGDWITNARGTLTFTSTTFTPWTVTSRGTFTFTCLENNGTIYISKSDSFTYLGLTWYAYLCFDLNAINTNAFYYNIGSATEPDAGNDKVRIFPDGTTITQDLICDSTNYVTGTHDVMVKSGSAASAASTCPAPLLYKWAYSFDSGSGDSCSSGSELNACTSSMVFNYTSCNTPVAYSAGGDLYCIYSTTSGSTTYLNLYNNDATTDESSTYRYTCMVMTSSGSNVLITQYPQRCLADQNSTAVTSPGAALVLSSSTSCDPTTTTTTTTTTAAPVTEVSSALAVGLGVTFALVIILILVGVLVYFLWKKQKDEKARGNKDVEGVTQVKEVNESEGKGSGEGGDGKMEQTFVDRLDGGVDPKPDLLPRETSPSFENGRPTTSGSIHVSMSGDLDDRDNKTIELIPDEQPDMSNGYSVVGVHPAVDDVESSGSEVVPFKTFGPQKAVVPKGAVALSNGTKPRPKVGKRNKLPPVDGKHLPPIVEDSTPRGGTTRRGSNTSTVSGLKKKFPRGTVGIQESNESSDDLPGQPDRRNKGPVKLRQMRSLKVAKKPGQDKPPERKLRTRSFRENKDTSQDDEESAPQSNTVKVTRVDIPGLSKTEPKKSPKNKRSDLKVVEMDGRKEKSVSNDVDIRGISPEPSYTPTSLHLRGFPPEIVSIAHRSPAGRAGSPIRPMLRDGPNSSGSSRYTPEEPIEGVRFREARPRSSNVNRSASMYDRRSGGQDYSRQQFSSVSSDSAFGTNRVSPGEDSLKRNRSRSRSKGRKKKALMRSVSEVRPSSAPAYTPKSITLEVEEIPRHDDPNNKVLAAHSLAVDMEQVSFDKYGKPETDGTKRGKDVRARVRRAAKRSKSSVVRPSSSAVEDDRSLRFWVFFAKPIILMTKKFQPSSFMRKRDELMTRSLDDRQLRSPRSLRRSSTVASRRTPVQIEFGTADLAKIRELD